MGLFSRNKEAADGPRVDDVAFDALRRSPRRSRTARSDNAGDPPSPLDPADAAKSRARHRLIGAVALALAAIVFVPMLFDRAPVPTSDDIALQIPDRDSPFEGRRGVPGVPLKASSDLPVVPQAPKPGAVTPPASATNPVAEPPSAAPPSIKTVDTADAKPAEPKSADRIVAKPPEKVVDTTPRTAQATDDPKALAALAGKTGSSLPPAAETANGRTYAVQVAAYATVARARVLRDQLVSNGLKSYTEPVSTAQGVWTRVRLGPFASRTAADDARQKLKTMKLDGSVVPL